MTGHALLSTNFNTLQSHLQSQYNGQSIGFMIQRLRVQIPVEVGDCFIFKKYTNFQLAIILETTLLLQFCRELVLVRGMLPQRGPLQRGRVYTCRLRTEHVSQWSVQVSPVERQDVQDFKSYSTNLVGSLLKFVID